MILSKADYEEPCCPLKTPSNVTPIPTGRMIDKLDEYLGRNDYDSAERHLKYWLMEADAGNDLRGRLSVLNEQIGLYRKLGKKEEGLEASEKALKLSEEIGFDGTVTMGTTLVNAATAYKAFGMGETALELYKKARVIYEKNLMPTDGKLGGLYNNMALAVMDTGDFDEAEKLFYKALSIMEKNENGEIERAVTYCNLADLAAAKLGAEDAEKVIEEHLDRALELLNTDTLPKDGYYAFVCEKCAPTFGYYGYFMAASDLKKRAEEIYERN